jgi:N-acetylglutamate synthase-like GNAT family acetyltransferase
MTVRDIRVSVVTDSAEIPGWIDMMRDYLKFGISRHEEATGQKINLESQIQKTLANVDDFLGPNGRFIVAERPNGDLIGMVLLHRLANGKGEVTRLFVRPEVRRAGLARRLMDKLEAEGRRMGLSALYLDTNSGLKEAIAFYKALGFIEVAFDPSSAQEPEIAKHQVFMEKPL